MGKPANYAVIDKCVSRSAQPLKEDFLWLKEQGITDVINFRTMFVSAIDFNEKEIVENLGMNYHNIQTITSKPQECDIKNFISLINKIKENNGKAHIHCKAGADRTGMYAFIYKTLQKISTPAENIQEWIRMGHDTVRYPDLINDAKSILEKNFDMKI